METKVFALVLLCACTIQAFSLPRRSSHHKAAPLGQDFGPQVKEVVDGVLLTIAEGEPIALPIPELLLNLTELVGAIIGKDESPIKGNMEVYAPAIGLKPDSVCDHAVVILNSIVQPLNLDVAVDLPGIGLVGDYKIDAVLLNLIPVRGSGRFFLGANLAAGLVADMKFKLGTNPGTFTSFDYSLNLRSLDVSLDGLIGGPDLSAEINKIINNLIDNEITPNLVALEALLHPLISASIHDIANELVAEITYADIVDLLQPKP